MILELNGIDVECVIGERAEERTRTQRLLVDIRLEIGDAATESDALSDTVDYAALTEKVRAALVAAKCRMIERAAKVVCDLCREDRERTGAAACIVAFQFNRHFICSGIDPLSGICDCIIRIFY